MRSKFTNKHLMSVFFCSAGLVYSGQAIGQNQPVPANEVQALESDANNAGNSEVSIGDTGEIDLLINDLEITKILQLLSIESERNITASRDVSGKISVNLVNVTFEQAMDAILIPNGYRWIEEGNFITVVTAAEYEKRQEANRPMVTKVVRLNYLRASDAVEFVKPLLTEGTGSISSSGDVEDGFQADVANGGSNQYSGAPTLVIRGYEDQVTEIVSLLEQLDVQPKQVIIEATILTASLTENNAFGVDFALFQNLNSVNPLAAVGDLINGTTGVAGGSFVGNAQPAIQEGVKLGFVAGDAAVFVRALDSVTDTTLIATPKTTVLDRNRADILVGQKIAYLSTTVTETSETQTVEFLEVGTQLSVRPFVSDDGKIRLELRPSVSDATIRTIGTTTAPDEETVELITNVIVESGQTIVLGGLFTEDTTVGREQVPGLGNIRGIGRAFQGQDDTVSRSEVIFLVKATVVDNHTLVELGEEGMARVDTASVAEREQLLPWSRSKNTSSHLINARRHFDEAQALSGEAREEKLKKALFCVDMALHLNPSMVDALLLKQEITGQQLPIYLESNVIQTFDAVLDNEIDELGLPAMPDAGAAVPATEPAPQAQAEEEALADVVARALAQSDAEQAATEPEQPAEGLATVETHEQEMDEIWLQKMLDEGAADPATEPVEPEVVEFEAPAQPAQVTEVEPQSSAAPAQPTDFEDIEPLDVKPQDTQVAEGEPVKIFGYAWRSLSTAQLLQLAAQAGVETDSE